MLGESLRYRKDKAARSKSVGVGTRRERAVEVGKPCGGYCAVASPYGLERRIEAAAQI